MKNKIEGKPVKTTLGSVDVPKAASIGMAAKVPSNKRGKGTKDS